MAGRRRGRGDRQCMKGVGRDANREIGVPRELRRERLEAEDVD
jgi:hypothetical protein